MILNIIFSLFFVIFLERFESIHSWKWISATTKYKPSLIQMKTIKNTHNTFIFTSLMTVTLFFNPQISYSTNILQGEKLFNANCAGCHEGGGNLFSPSKSLKKEALLTNGYYDSGKLVEIISKGKNLMPAYGETISPKGNTIPAKFSNEQLRILSSYIIEQADTDWPKRNDPSTKRNCDEYPGC